MSTVSVVTCRSYEPAALDQALRSALEPLGGIAGFVRPGMNVLLKPNLLAPLPPERGVDTHPALISAVARLVRQAGGQVLVGDSPGGPTDIAPQVWRASGLGAIAEAEGIPLVSFDSGVWRQHNGHGYLIARPVLEADLIINLPKLKTHSFVLYTGAIKNLFGAIPGTRKRELHLRAPGVEEFSHVLVDVLALTRPGLSIVDGILGLEGNGPGASGRPRAYNCLLASADPVAVDAVCAHALGFGPGRVRHIELAAARGLGTAALEHIRIVGEPRALEFGHVRLPAARWLFRVPPPGITRPLDSVLRARPRFIAGACVGCGSCVQACPVGALEAGRPPRLSRATCVGCLCCAEICPHAAIEPQRSLLARLAGLGR